ncbi:MAG: glutamate synthase-related protein, partial [Alphaproteobacteria bacterium]|nr:glutamate synthase-related protein [Alphaproteobacteria bacterium]
WCNAARSFMFSIGCVQTKKCHTDRCPTGVATQNQLRQRGIVVADKGPRVHAFHSNTMKGLAQYVGSAGLKDPAELKPHHLHVRLGENQILDADSLYGFMEPGALRDAPEDTNYARWWAQAQADTFEPKNH